VETDYCPYPNVGNNFIACKTNCYQAVIKNMLLKTNSVIMKL